MQDFHQLEIWKAHRRVCASTRYRTTSPPSDNFGLVLNLRRSAVVTPRSIAEGCGLASDAEFAVDLKRARAACHDLEYVVLLCRDLTSAIYTELIS